MTRSQCLSIFGLSAGTLTLALLLVGASSAPHVPAVGETAPPFLGYELNGKKVLLDSYAGKVVVVSFWATWCPPCRAELAILENIQKAGRGSIQVVAINIESHDVFRRAAQLLKDFTLQLTNDESRTGYSAYAVKALPHLVVIGKDMRIISVREGYGPSELDDVTNELNAALRAGSADGAKSTTESH